MQRAWLEFARCGDPGHDGLPDWPAFAPARRPTMLFTRRTRVEDAPFAERLLFWRALENDAL